MTRGESVRAFGVELFPPRVEELSVSCHPPSTTCRPGRGTNCRILEWSKGEISTAVPCCHECQCAHRCGPKVQGSPCRRASIINIDFTSLLCSRRQASPPATARAHRPRGPGRRRRQERQPSSPETPRQFAARQGAAAAVRTGGLVI